MLKNRRIFIKKIISVAAYGLAISQGLVHSTLAHAQWLKERFSEGDYEQSLNHLFNQTEFIETKQIKFSRLPRIAENGAIVPITITTSIENVDKISILATKNPHPLIAEFYLSPEVVPKVSARIKLAKSSDIVVIVEAEGNFYRKTQPVKVTLGGCGP